MATIKLNREQRDAIYGELALDLSGTGDIRISVDGEDYDAARRLRRRYEDDMRLLDDLGWEPEQDRDEFEITMDHDDLSTLGRRHAAHLRRRAIGGRVRNPRGQHTGRGRGYVRADGRRRGRRRAT
jgi:hypothetical protein